VLNCSLKVSNYKCFGDDPVGFDHILRVNLLVGRNNSGKSALLDIIEKATKEKVLFENHEKRRGSELDPKLLLRIPLEETAIRQVFSENRKSAHIPTANDWLFGKRFIGSEIEIILNAENKSKFSDLYMPNNTSSLPKKREGQEFELALANTVKNPFQKKIFKRIFAERNIEPESHSGISFHGSGQGITNLIQNFKNDVNLDSTELEKKLLNHLNLICAPDSVFRDIVCKRNGADFWEIFLEEEHKGRIPLSSTGSGLKTIIIVLCYILLLPVVARKPLSDFIFAFEELENNLHPALLRRLIAYLLDASAKNNFLLFLTTHSNVLIDAVNQIEDAQIIHVTHDSKLSTAQIARTHIHTKGILDDLDVRASDLLQANGIVWVEGPSDRIYLRRWIELFSGATLIEGLHYQTVFYGGRLLAHLSASVKDDAEGIQLFRVNRNNLILIDSDKRAFNSQLNDTKKRIISEIKDGGGFAWVTKGREIENYIPVSAFENLLRKKISSLPDQYGSVFDWLDSVEKNKGKYYVDKKPLMAEQIAPYLEESTLNKLFDFEVQITLTIDAIKSWNAM
jgi:putative ATP-dependent endonuclease of OLD family